MHHINTAGFFHRISGLLAQPVKESGGGFRLHVKGEGTHGKTYELAGLPYNVRKGHILR